MQSLQNRLLLVASLVLLGFLGLGALALDRAFRESVDRALQQGLQEQVFALLGAADEDEQGRMRLPDDLPNPRFAKPDSGLYAAVEGEEGAYRWRSRSMIGRTLLPLLPLAPGTMKFDLEHADGEPLMVIRFGLSWEDFQGRELGYTLGIAMETRGMLTQVDSFRARLFYWLGGSALLLLAAQGLVLRWSLKPLRRVAIDLKRVESGEIDQIQGPYPRELAGLVRNLNALILSGRAARDRYRHSLGDLAHSLKTPLALMQSAMESRRDEELRAAVADQVPRMDEIIRYQLRRAAASSAGERGGWIYVRRVAERLQATLDKVYRGKGVAMEMEIGAGEGFQGDESDLMECMGNLMDNAYKYCVHRVRVRSGLELDGDAGQPRLKLTFEDDGQGIPEAVREEVMYRGVRLDQRQPGQGIGLSVAREIIVLYGGAMNIGESGLGGALITLTLPRS